MEEAGALREALPRKIVAEHLLPDAVAAIRPKLSENTVARPTTGAKGTCQRRHRTERRKSAPGYHIVAATFRLAGAHADESEIEDRCAAEDKYRNENNPFEPMHRLAPPS